MRRSSADGRYEVLPMAEAAKIGQIFCTGPATKHVDRKGAPRVMKDGAIICNTGHFNVEIDIRRCGSSRSRRVQATQFVEEFTLADGRRLYLLAEGPS